MAPELFSAGADGNIEFTSAVDVFALGSSMLSLGAGKLPACIRKRPPQLPCDDLDFAKLALNLDGQLATTLNRCFQISPSDRPTASEIANAFKRVLLHGRHRALININGNANYLDNSNRKVTASVAGLATVVIEYDGDQFVATQVQGDVFVNNIKIGAGHSFPGSCVIAFGAPELQNKRVYVTFDVSHPGVEV
jgi:serine/threonine-protein kinase